MNPKMSPERWQRVREVANLAFELEGTDPWRYVDAACDDDPTLRAQVERLVRADAEASGFLSRPAARALGFSPELLAEEPVERASESEIPGRIGPYRIEHRIHTGGMGEVYAAVRDDEEFERRVAIKWIRRRIDSDRVRQWFLAERQILARLEHPNIARLYDGGTTEQGSPYLVMELIDGQPLDIYCETQRLTIDQRLQLFLGVCDAVAHAHRNLLIHRDLKPSNILVTPEGVPKLLDFGIAKQLETADAEDAAGDEALTSTEGTGSRPLTPGYASPEQIRGEPITTATDVHALGILLFELLTGQRLFARQGLLPYELEREICEQEPPVPSRTVGRTEEATGNEQNQTSPTTAPPGKSRELARTLAGDLDAIVLAALRKNPEQRYASAESLAEDIRCYRHRLPVSASKQTWSYRASKTWQRHRLGLTMVAVVIALTVGFFVALYSQALETARERDGAEQALRLLTTIFEGADPYSVHGEQLTARQVLDHAASQLGEGAIRDPSIRSRLLDSVGRIYLGLGQLDASAALFEQALASSRELWPKRGVHARDLQNLGELRLRRHDYEGAKEAFEQALEIRARVDANPSKIAESRHALAEALTRLGKVDRAHEIVRASVSEMEAIYGPESPEAGGALEYLGMILRFDQREAEAIEAYQRALWNLRVEHGDQHPRLARLRAALAVLLGGEGRQAEALELLHEVYENQKRVLGETHPSTVTTLHNIASNLIRQGEYAEAEERLLDVLEHRRKTPDPEFGQSLYNLTTLYLRTDRAEPAAETAEKALEVYLETLGPDGGMTCLTRAHLAEAHRRLGRLEQAEEQAQEALAQLEARIGTEHSALYHPLAAQLRIHLDRGQAQAAEAVALRVSKIAEARLGSDHWRVAVVRGLLGASWLLQGRTEEASDVLDASHRILVRELGAEDPRTLEIAEYRDRLQAV